ncbi:MAG: gamma-glutamyltransferase [Alphaproteobacteria bacterium]
MREKSRCGIPLRQCIASLTTLIMVGCAGGSGPQWEGTEKFPQRFLGGVAADEARAALVGKDILSAGGSSADAAVAMAFALMVSRPDAAGPGGGGICMHYDKTSNKAETLVFLPTTSEKDPPKGRWSAPVPGSFRGLFSLHARYGKLRWEQMVQPAERAARFGWPISKGLFAALRNGGTKGIKDERTRNIFSASRYRFLSFGETVKQFSLAGTLGAVRRLGPGDFYSGQLARMFVEGVLEAGGWIAIKDLRSYRPVWRKTVQAGSGYHTLHFPFSNNLENRIAHGIWTQIGNKPVFSSSSETQKAALLAAATRNVSKLKDYKFAKIGGSVGLFSMDVSGNATSCTLTMNRSFGSGVMAGETGIILAAPPEAESSLSIAPVIMANHNIGRALLAATAAGDQYAGIVLASTLMRVLDGKVPVEKALAKPRYAPGLAPTNIIVEKSLSRGEKETMINKGLELHTRHSIGQVNLIFCNLDIEDRVKSCVLRTDPRTAAYGVNSEF